MLKFHGRFFFFFLVAKRWCSLITNDGISSTRVLVIWCVCLGFVCCLDLKILKELKSSGVFVLVFLFYY